MIQKKINVNPLDFLTLNQKEMQEYELIFKISKRGKVHKDNVYGQSLDDAWLRLGSRRVYQNIIRLSARLI